MKRVDIMEKKSEQRRQFHIGKRVVKTAAAILCCFLIYDLRGHKGLPFNCIVAVIICMQSNMGRSWAAARNRLIGTGIGIAYGITVVIMTYFINIPERIYYVLVSAVVILVLETAVLLKQKHIADFSCITFLSIAIGQITEGALLIDVVNRILDTLIGIAAAILINAIELPKKKRRDVLFLANLDETLRGSNNMVSSYSVISLNSLIQDGMKFSIFTKETPASLTYFTEHIKMNLPVIVMDGCALYDTMNHKYISKILINRDSAAVVKEIAENMGMVCCFNVLIQDVLLIYFDHFPHMAMQEMYRQQRRSPYWNYICGVVPEDQEDQMIYIKIMDKRDKILKLENRIKCHPVFDSLRIKRQKVDIEGFQEYLYLCIMNKDASRTNASGNLCKTIGAKEIISFGGNKWSYDVEIKDDDSREVVKKIKQMYEVNLWKKI